MTSEKDSIVKKLESLLISEMKFSEIGKLASGIIHNLNTPISIIQGNAELLQLKYKDLPEINLILKQVERLNSMLSEISIKSKNNLVKSESTFDLNDLIKNELKALEGNLFFKHYIKVTLDFDKKAPQIHAFYSDFSFIILSILKNAIDAMYKQDERILSIQTKSDNESSISVRIKDTGRGMSADLVKKIFDPFFTTKPSEEETIDDDKAPRGIGIDLYLADLLMVKYNIERDILSSPGQGTEFILNIPVKKNG